MNRSWNRADLMPLVVAVVVALGLGAEAVNAACDPCSRDAADCCKRESLSMLLDCHQRFGPSKANNEADPAAEEACFGLADKYFSWCLSQIDPIRCSQLPPEDPGDDPDEGENRHSVGDTNQRERVLSFPTMLVYAGDRPAGERSFGVFVPEGGTWELVVLNGIPEVDPDTGDVIPSSEPASRGVEGVIEVDGRVILEQGEISQAAATSARVSLNRGVHEFHFALDVVDPQDGFGVLIAALRRVDE